MHWLPSFILTFQYKETRRLEANQFLTDNHGSLDLPVAANVEAARVRRVVKLSVRVAVLCSSAEEQHVGKVEPRKVHTEHIAMW